MAPLWRSMLSKSSPLYRESLCSFSLWECRAQQRELALLKKHTDRERRGLLRQLDKLSKELQQKDKVIESLRAKLNPHQPRPDTPCSSHALSEATDQSDRISFVSDEQGSTNEELELGSDVEAASEYGQDERASTDSHSHGGSMSRRTSIPPSSIASSSHGPHSSVSCPSMHFSPHKPLDVQSQTGYNLPQTKLFQGFPLPPHHAQANPPCFLPQSYHTYHPSPLGGAGPGTGLNPIPAMKPAAGGLLESSALWDMTYGGARPTRAGADLSSGSSGYQSGTSHTGSELVREHLREIRTLRQRLEDSILTNERLRQQLEDRLASTARDTGAPTNIYIQGLDSASQLSSQIRALKEDNASLQEQLRQASRGSSEGAERLKEAELERERWEEQGRRLQTHTQAQAQEITQLKQERQRDQETINRLQHEASVLQQQLAESRALVRSLQRQLHMYQHPGPLGEEGPPRRPPAEVTLTPSTFDPRDLQVQLERRLSGGRGQGETRPHAKRQLFNEHVFSPPVRDPGLCQSVSPASPLSPTLETQESEPTGPAGWCVEGPSPDVSLSSRAGRRAVGHLEDFSALRQQILEGGLLVRKMETALRSSSTSHVPLGQGPDTSLDPGTLSGLLASTKTLRQILEEADSLLKMFWRAALPERDDSHHSTMKEQQEEISCLRLRVTEQEEALREAMDRLHTSNRSRDGMEHLILSQLSRTRDVLKKAKTNLQEKRTRDATVNSPALLVGVS